MSQAAIPCDRMITALGYEPTKGALADLGALLRRLYGAGAVFERVLITHHKQPAIILSGFGEPSVAPYLRAKGGFVPYIDASADKRHEPVMARGRDGEHVTPHHLRELDAREADSGIIHGDNLSVVRPLADAVVLNDRPLADFYHRLDALLPRLSEMVNTK